MAHSTWGRWAALPYDDIDRIRDAIRPRWAREVFTALTTGPLRYSDLLHGITLASGEMVHGRTLSATLKTLERQGFIEHKGDYRLRAGGERLVRILAAIELWSRENPKAGD